MFAEYLIIGQRTCKIDSKGRFFLPKFSHVEEGDNLVLLQNYKTNIYELHALSKIQDRIDKLKDNMCSASNSEQLELLRKEYELLCLSCLANLNVDGQHRVHIPMEIYIKSGFDKSTVALGVGDHLNLFTDDAQVIEYKKSLLKK